MAKIKLAKGVNGVTVLTEDPAGGGMNRRVLNIAKRKRKKPKKGSSLLRPHEKMARRAAEALQVGVKEYLKRHKRSNLKKRNGWMRDEAVNLEKAERKAINKFY